MFPEHFEVGLVPDLDRPGHNVVRAVAVHQVAQRGLHQRAPGFVVRRGRDVAGPVEHGLRAAGELFGHEAELQERPQAQPPVGVHDAVQIGEVVFGMFGAGFVLVFLVDGHIVMEQAMAADVLEADLLLDQRELVLIFFLQSQAHAAGADAEIHAVVERDLRVGGNVKMQLFHDGVLPFLFVLRKKRPRAAPARALHPCIVPE